MKSIGRGWAIFGAFTLWVLASPPPVQAAKPSASPTPTWSQKMRGLESVLQELLLDINSDERFNSPKNRTRIEKNAEKFARLAHALQLKDGASPDGDLSIPVIAGQFAEEANHAYRTLKSGHREYARGVLKSMTGYCIACHTRNSYGPSFQSFADSPTVKALQPLAKADLLTALRQFERAMDEYSKIISDPVYLAERGFEWERAVRSGLAVSVRVLKDPDRALKLVETVLSSPKAPFFLKEQAKQWKLSLQEWKSEKVKTAVTDAGYHALTIRLIADAKALQKFPADRSADVLYLRASSTAHDLLSLAPNGDYATDALYLIGLSYEVLQGLDLWDQHEFYYLACIQRSPHTEKARMCFRQYEQSVYLGYSGSGGTHVPADVQQKLKKLELLSSPVTDKKTDRL